MKHFLARRNNGVFGPFGAKNINDFVEWFKDNLTEFNGWKVVDEDTIKDWEFYEVTGAYVAGHKVVDVKKKPLIDCN